MLKRLGGCLFLLLCTVAVLALASWPEQPAEQAPVMGIVCTASEDDWKDEQYRLLEAEAQAHGFDRMVLRTERTQQAQIDAIRALIVYRADVIVFSPMVQSGWENVLHEAKQAGIPVLAVDKSLAQTDGLAGYVGFGYRKAARQAAAYLATQGHTVAAELYGTLNASNAQEIARGFREGFEDIRTTLKYSLCGDFLRSRGYEIMETFEQEYTGITLVLCQNDAMALGAIDYLNTQGLQPGVDVKLCVFGGGDEVQACREKGQIDLVAQCDNEELAHETAHAALRLLEDPTTPVQREIPIALQTGEAAP